MKVTRLALGVLILAAGTGGAFASDGKRDAAKPPAAAPSVVTVPGQPSLMLGSYDLAPLGYQADEFFVSGTATWFKQDQGPDAGPDVHPAGTAPYTTRLVVVRPTDPAKFSGTVVVEWMNVTAGFDVPAEWSAAHREIVRRGHAYVGVTAQKAGIDGGAAPPLDVRVVPLRKADPKRYGPLDHPGDAYAFDLFSQAGRVVKDAATTHVLGPLVPRKVIAAGESQSGMFLTTFVTAVDPLAKVYDGFLIHSRFGFAAPLHGAVWGALVNGKPTTLRPDLRVPVMTVVMENDVVGWPPLLGYHAARQPDTDRLRVWEVAGTAHADNYAFAIGFLDSGSLPTEQLAAAFAPTRTVLGSRFDEPMNFGPQQHYVTEAALWQLDRWIRTGEVPPKGAPLKLSDGEPPKLMIDANGLAEGGVRTPWVDVPTALLSGVGNAGGPLAAMVGLGKPFDAATLQRLYPGGKVDYLKQFKASLDKTIAAGFILPEDKPEILAVAALNLAAPPAATADAAPGPQALVDKAIRALGGADKLAKVKAASWTAKGTLTSQGNEILITLRITMRGTDHFRRDSEIETGAAPSRGTTVVAGDKGWAKFMDVVELDKEQLANQQRLAYLSVIPVTVLPLKGNEFKLEAIPDEPVLGRPAAGLKVTPPDGKAFRLYFDKESGLPVRLVAKVLDYKGVEYTDDTTYADYKLVDGIQKATRVETKRDGEKASDLRVTDFKVLDHVDPDTFDRPK